ncbi:hypothetical protein HK097_003406 [Rhizophlyctis rosea]|uniref:GYF domain-containing protein n=1 Tax=Rhizophlyctis rosea TaxID=64517 RepID=A0AAD5X4Z8_9FUNG|nr:hypothetical protein HK097_003406 [Rhizophlyctis rosea]
MGNTASKKTASSSAVQRRRRSFDTVVHSETQSFASETQGNPPYDTTTAANANVTQPETPPDSLMALQFEQHLSPSGSVVKLPTLLPAVTNTQTDDRHSNIPPPIFNMGSRSSQSSTKQYMSFRNSPRMLRITSDAGSDANLTNPGNDATAKPSTTPSQLETFAPELRPALASPEAVQSDIPTDSPTRAPDRPEAEIGSLEKTSVIADEQAVETDGGGTSGVASETGEIETDGREKTPVGADQADGEPETASSSTPPGWGDRIWDRQWSGPSNRHPDVDMWVPVSRRGRKQPARVPVPLPISNSSSDDSSSENSANNSSDNRSNVAVTELRMRPLRERFDLSHLRDDRPPANADPMPDDAAVPPESSAPLPLQPHRSASENPPADGSEFTSNSPIFGASPADDPNARRAPLRRGRGVASNAPWIRTVSRRRSPLPGKAGVPPNAPAAPANPHAERSREVYIPYRPANPANVPPPARSPVTEDPPAQPANRLAPEWTRPPPFFDGWRRGWDGQMHWRNPGPAPPRPGEPPRPNGYGDYGWGDPNAYNARPPPPPAPLHGEPPRRPPGRERWDIRPPAEADDQAVPEVPLPDFPRDPRREADGDRRDGGRPEPMDLDEENGPDDVERLIREGRQRFRDGLEQLRGIDRRRENDRQGEGRQRPRDPMEPVRFLEQQIARLQMADQRDREDQQPGRPDVEARRGFRPRYPEPPRWRGPRGGFNLFNDDDGDELPHPADPHIARRFVRKTDDRKCVVCLENEDEAMILCREHHWVHQICFVICIETTHGQAYYLNRHNHNTTKCVNENCDQTFSNEFIMSFANITENAISTMIAGRRGVGKNVIATLRYMHESVWSREMAAHAHVRQHGGMFDVEFRPGYRESQNRIQRTEVAIRILNLVRDRTLRHEVFKVLSANHRDQVFVERIENAVDCTLPLDSSDDDDEGWTRNSSLVSDASYRLDTDTDSSAEDSDSSFDREEEAEKAALIKEGMKDHARQIRRALRLDQELETLREAHPEWTDKVLHRKCESIQMESNASACTDIETSSSGDNQDPEPMCGSDQSAEDGKKVVSLHEGGRSLGLHVGHFPPKWMYIDPKGRHQGPFTSDQMHYWYRKEYFKPDIPVKRTRDEHYRPLREFIEKYGTDRPFLSELDELEELDKMEKENPAAPAAEGPAVANDNGMDEEEEGPVDPYSSVNLWAEDASDTEEDNQHGVSLCTSRPHFKRQCRVIGRKYKPGLKFSHRAVTALQTAAEDYLTELFSDAQTFAVKMAGGWNVRDPMVQPVHLQSAALPHEKQMHFGRMDCEGVYDAAGLKGRLERNGEGGWRREQEQVDSGRSE